MHWNFTAPWISPFRNCYTDEITFHCNATFCSVGGKILEILTFFFFFSLFLLFFFIGNTTYFCQRSFMKKSRRIASLNGRLTKDREVFSCEVSWRIVTRRSPRLEAHARRAEEIFINANTSHDVRPKYIDISSLFSAVALCRSVVPLAVPMLLN